MILHLMGQASINIADFVRLGEEDAIVLQHANVWLACQEGCRQLPLQQAAGIYVMQEDLQLFGIEETRLMPQVKVINMVELVQLTTRYERIKTWRCS